MMVVVMIVMKLSFFLPRLPFDGDGDSSNETFSSSSQDFHLMVMVMVVTNLSCLLPTALLCWW
jgi:hypothetical protein